MGNMKFKNKLLYLLTLIKSGVEIAKCMSFIILIIVFGFAKLTYKIVAECFSDVYQYFDIVLIEKIDEIHQKRINCLEYNCLRRMYHLIVRKYKLYFKIYNKQKKSEKEKEFLAKMKKQFIPQHISNFKKQVYMFKSTLPYKTSKRMVKKVKQMQISIEIIKGFTEYF